MQLTDHCSISHNRIPFPTIRENLFAFSSLFVLLAIIYSNSFNVPFHYDDFKNIVENSNVHMREFSFDSLKNVLYGKKLNHTYDTRPLSYLTFSLNYYLSNLNVLGYHIANFSIHYITSVFLFLFIFITLNRPLLKNEFQKNAYAISLFSVLFWASHPIQVTAVTYIVQRMASMSGMFYIMSMFFYLIFRLETQKNRKLICLILCFSSFLFSLASKENAAMLPASLFLYDLIILQGATSTNIKKSIKPFMIIFICIIVIALLFTSPSSIFNGYKARFFTMIERLLTEPRVILFYISLLLYPISSRFTLLHDIKVSKNLVTPLSTMPGILSIILIIGLGLYLSRKHPLACFGILFFFLNHLIESSILPLELIYEHRNYLPSMFFFLICTILFFKILNHFPKDSPMRPFIFFCVLILLISQSHTTYMRNNIFLSEISLWKDNVEKAPLLSTAHLNYGKRLWEVGYQQEAMEEYTKAKNLNRFNNKLQQNILNFNIALYDAYEIKSYSRALSSLQEVFKTNNGYPNIWSELSRLYMIMCNYPKALSYADTALCFWPDNPDLLNTRSVILLKQNDLGSALEAAKKTCAVYPRKAVFMETLAEIYRKQHNIHDAIKTWKNLIHYHPDHLPAYFALIEQYTYIGKEKKSHDYIDFLLKNKKDQSITDLIEICREHPETKIYLPNPEILLPIINAYEAQQSFLHQSVKQG